MASRRQGAAGLEKNRRSPLRVATSLTLLAMAALIAIASFSGDKRLWGINHLAFYPGHIRLIALSLILISLVPSVSRRLYGWLLRAVDAVKCRKWLVTAAIDILPVIAVVVFHRFRTAHLLLGDARLVATNFERAFDPRYDLMTSSLQNILLLAPTAKGATALYRLAGRVSVDLFHASPVEGIRTLNCILGGVLIYIVLKAILRKNVSSHVTIWVGLLVLTSGAMQLFFGYVENYTPLLTVGVLYLVSGLAYIRFGGRRWLVAALVTLGLCVFAHIQGILLAPSFLLLLAWHIFGSRLRGGSRGITLSIGALVLIATYAAFAFTKYNEHFLPLTATPEARGVFTLSHLGDILNELVIILPLAPVLVVLLALSTWLAVRQTGDQLGAIGNQGSSPAGRAARAPARPAGAEIHFTFLVLLPCLLFLLLFRPELGMARDWDLFAVTALGLLPLIAVLVDHMVRVIRPEEIGTIAVPALVICTVQGVSWIGINASADRAGLRYERILEYDRINAAYAYEILAQHYRDQGDFDGAIRAIKSAISAAENARLYALLGVYYADRGLSQEAKEVLREALGRWPRSHHARHELVRLLYEAGEWDELIEVATPGTQYHPERPIYHHLLGKALIRKGEIGAGRRELLQAKRLNPPEPVLRDIDRELLRLRGLGSDPYD